MHQPLIAPEQTTILHKIRLHLPRSHLSTTKTYVNPPCVRFFSTKIIYRCNRFLYTQPCYNPSVHSTHPDEHEPKRIVKRT